MAENSATPGCECACDNTCPCAKLVSRVRENEIIKRCIFSFSPLFFFFFELFFVYIHLNKSYTSYLLLLMLRFVGFF